jgi:hypothetical protein
VIMAGEPGNASGRGATASAVRPVRLENARRGWLERLGLASGCSWWDGDHAEADGGPAHVSIYG